MSEPTCCLTPNPSWSWVACLATGCPRWRDWAPAGERAPLIRQPDTICPQCQGAVWANRERWACENGHHG